MPRFLPSLLLIFASLLVTAPRSHAQTVEALFSKDSVALLTELRQMAIADQQYRRSAKKYKAHFEAQSAIDSANTRRIIDITKTYGFPSTHRFQTDKGNIVLPHLMLVHAPQSFFAELGPLLLAERAAGRISANEYAHVRWHLDGRVSAPAFEDEQGTQKTNGGKTSRGVIRF